MVDSPNNVRSRISSDSSKELGQHFESSSSSDNSSGKKSRRKVIRRTEQLQFFDADASGVTDIAETRRKRKTKKTKHNTILPKIGDIAEEIKTNNRISTRRLTRYHKRKLTAEQHDSLTFIDDSGFNKHPKKKRSPRVISHESRNENVISLAPNLSPAYSSTHLQVSNNNTQNEVKEECKSEISDEEIETRRKKKTKKTKHNTILPKIGDIAEEINTDNRISTRRLTRYHKRKLTAEQHDSQMFIDDSGFNKHPKKKRSPRVISEESRNENVISLASSLLPIDTSRHLEVSDNNNIQNELKEECKNEVSDKGIDNVLSKSNSHNLPDEREQISLKDEIQIPQIATENLINMNTDDCEISLSQNKLNTVPEHSLKMKDRISLKPYSKTPLSTQKSQSGSFKIGIAGKNTPRHQIKSLEKPLTRTKMPNFSLIHKKAFEKMESIDQLSQRKAERAKILLSGNKPPIGLAGIKQSPVVIEDKKSRRYLDFESDNKPNNINSLPLREINNKFIHKTTTSKIISRPFKSKRISKPNLLKSKAVIAKPYVPPKSKITTEIVKTDLSPALNGATNDDIKTIKQKNKEERCEEMKIVANKMKVVKHGLDERRNLIKGVRSNRRFDLLMKMRMKM